MDNLIGRLEVPECGNRGLDCEIAWLVGWDATGNVGQKWRDHYPSWKDNGYILCRAADNYNVPHYTTSVDAALPRENIVAMEKTPAGYAATQATEDGDGTFNTYVGQGKTEPLARRIAALKALSPAGE